jgi:hypothetical protein
LDYLILEPPRKYDSLSEQQQLSIEGTMTTNTFSIDGRRFYDTEMVQSLMENAPIEPISTTKVVKLLDEPQWDTDLSAIDVLRNPKQYPNHTRRIEQADLSYPILVVTVDERDGIDFVIADGMHRLAKSVKNGLPMIYIQRIPQSVLDEAFLFEDTTSIEFGPDRWSRKPEKRQRHREKKSAKSEEARKDKTAKRGDKRKDKEAEREEARKDKASEHSEKRKDREARKALNNCATCDKSDVDSGCACGLVSYCSTHCQAANWSQHRQVCSEKQ